MESHLLQMRGLKRCDYAGVRCLGRVASFTDAWIETLRKWKNPDKHLVASFTDAWIETKTFRAKISKRSGRIFYRCVD